MATTPGEPSTASSHAELRGVISDPSGAGIANATITLETSSGNEVATTATDASGHYALEIEGQAGATYRERVLAPGFRTLVTSNLTLSDGASRTSDLRLTIGDAIDTVTVTADATLGNGSIATTAGARLAISAFATCPTRSIALPLR